MISKPLVILVVVLGVINLALYISIRIKRKRIERLRAAPVAVEMTRNGTTLTIKFMKAAVIPPVCDFRVDYDAGLVGKAQIKHQEIRYGRTRKSIEGKAYINIKKRLRDQVKGRAIGLVSDNRLMAVFVAGYLKPTQLAPGRYKLYFVDAPGIKIAC